MSQTANPYLGYQAAVYVNGTFVTLRHYTVTDQHGKILSTNFQSLGVQEKVFGIGVVDVVLEGYADQNMDPWAILGFVSGGYVNNVRIYVSVTSAEYWTFNSLAIDSVKQEVNIEDAIKITVNCQSNGTWLYPTGVVPGGNP